MGSAIGIGKATPSVQAKRSRVWLIVLAGFPLLFGALAVPARAAGDGAPDSSHVRPGPAAADQVDVTTPADPAEALSAGAGVLAGVVVTDCGVSALSGCQGQPMPGVDVWIRTPDGQSVACLRTAADGAFWAPVPPGSYRVEVAQSGRALEVDVSAGQLVELEAALPRPAPPR